MIEFTLNGKVLQSSVETPNRQGIRSLRPTLLS